MRRKLLSILLVCILMISLTGCGKKSNSSNENASNTETITNNEETSTNVNNETIEDVANNYYTNLYNADSKTAYQYVDFVGVIAWIKKESAKPVEVASVFKNKYNEISNDSEFKDKILSHFSNEKMFERINSEIKTRDVNVEVSDIDNLGENLYSARVKVLYDLNGTNTGTDETLHFMKSNDGFFIVDDSALWTKKDVTDLIGAY